MIRWSPSRTRIAGAVAGIMLGLAVMPAAHAQEKLKVSLNWNAPNAGFVHHYAAKKMGFYAAEGLDVELLALPGSVPAVTSVAAGEAQLGQAGADAILVGMGQGAPLKVVWLLYQATPTGVIAPKKNTIRTLADLRGKTVSTAVASPEGILLRARLREVGVDPDRDVTLLNVAPAAKLTMMLTGQSDASTGFVNFQMIQAQMQGHDVTFIPFSTEKQPLYGHAVFASEKFVKEKPDVIRRYLKATIAGLLWARDNVDKAVDLVATWDPSVKIDAEFVRRDWIVQLNSLISSELTAKQGVGHMSDAGWKNLIDVLFDGKLVSSRLDPKTVYTNELIPANAKQWGSGRPPGS
jgi:NitT/TauT family transport system substrate-binding protein